MHPMPPRLFDDLPPFLSPGLSAAAAAPAREGALGPGVPSGPADAAAGVLSMLVAGVSGGESAAAGAAGGKAPTMSEMLQPLLAGPLAVHLSAVSWMDDVLARQPAPWGSLSNTEKLGEDVNLPNTINHQTAPWGSSIKAPPEAPPYPLPPPPPSRSMPDGTAAGGGSGVGAEHPKKGGGRTGRWGSARMGQAKQAQTGETLLPRCVAPSMRIMRCSLGSSLADAATHSVIQECSE